jgi:hypothetical protein
MEMNEASECESDHEDNMDIVDLDLLPDYSSSSRVLTGACSQVSYMSDKDLQKCCKVTKSCISELKKVQDDLQKVQTEVIKPINKQLRQKTGQIEARIKNALKSNSN